MTFSILSITMFLSLAFSVILLLHGKQFCMENMIASSKKCILNNSFDSNDQDSQTSLIDSLLREYSMS